MATEPDYFTSDPDWADYAKRKQIDLSSERLTEDSQLDISASRAAQAVEEREWSEKHPLESVGYQSHTQHVTVRDGHAVEIRVSWPIRSGTDVPLNDSLLPLLFVCHGGGWIQGTHITEQKWLLWPLMKQFEFVIVSVAYRLAPEHLFPTYINDCWDVLCAITMKKSSFSLHVPFNNDRVILCGSSAGGLITAALSQRARDHAVAAAATAGTDPATAAVRVHAVILNVPVTCDYRFWPDHKMNNSYRQCETGSLLSSSIMRQVWQAAVPDGVGGDPQASPLLGDLSDLPSHFIYVAGQDPLRDEGIEYARALKASGNAVTVRIYSGVPHTFGEMWELGATKRFWIDIVDDVKTIL